MSSLLAAYAGPGGFMTKKVEGLVDQKRTMQILIFTKNFQFYRKIGTKFRLVHKGIFFYYFFVNPSQDFKIKAFSCEGKSYLPSHFRAKFTKTGCFSKFLVNPA